LAGGLSAPLPLTGLRDWPLGRPPPRSRARTAPLRGLGCVSRSPRPPGTPGVPGVPGVQVTVWHLATHDETTQRDDGAKQRAEGKT
jgi:hypothetical protein